MAWWRVRSDWWLWGPVTACVAGLAEYWLTSGTSGWVPLVAGLLGAGVAVLPRLVLGGRKGESALSPRTEETDRAEKADQTLVVSRYTIAELTSAMEGDLTSLERDRRKQPFIDELVETRGVVSDVGRASFGDRLWIHLDVDDRSVTGWFDGSDTGVDSLRVGDRVRIRGRVDDLSPSFVRLEAAELVEVRAGKAELAAESLVQTRCPVADSGDSEPSSVARDVMLAAKVRYTAAEIILAMTGETDVGRKAKGHRYQGETLEEKGSVLNVREYDDGPALSIEIDDRNMIHAFFAGTHPGVASLRLGERVCVRGQFASADARSVQLVNSELIEVRAGDEGEAT